MTRKLWRPLFVSSRCTVHRISWYKDPQNKKMWKEIKWFVYHRMLRTVILRWPKHETEGKLCCRGLCAVGTRVRRDCWLSLQHRLSCHLRQSIQLESWALGLWGAALVNASILEPEQHSLCLAGGFPDASSWAFERGQWANIWSFCFVLLKLVLIKFLKIVDDDWPCEMLNLKIFFQCACEKIHVHVCSVPGIETGSFARVCHLVGKKCCYIFQINHLTICV